jgi:hypothetical protein
MMIRAAPPTPMASVPAAAMPAASVLAAASSIPGSGVRVGSAGILPGSEHSSCA